MQDFYTSDQIRERGIKCGENCYLHTTSLVYCPEHLELGDNVRIDAYSVLSCGASGFIRIGSFTHISSFTLLIGASGIDVAQYSAIAAGAKIYSVSDDLSGRGLIGPMVSDERRFLHRGQVTLESQTCIGANGIVMPSARLRYGSVLLANSLLLKDTESYKVYYGTPAKAVKDRRRDFESFL